ncbi:transcriptional regulator NrdR [Candidatus Peregrinibacteria bacterium HGW-Peregrinibacteria-1]|jgi:transcriptional repressor NrdR|nr:MAG: transcriptional regulator NrdR [Candidatus Peregrinibacteria bacterium HGW-Peregrinibacteria-1]
MFCPKCNQNSTRVLDSRETDGHRAVRRRRECEHCQNRFTTFERPEINKFVIVKKDGSRERYDREKVENGIWRACEKRKITEEQITTLINQLEEKWSNIGKEVNSEAIGEGIMESLKDLDEVAYIRFASVYRQFRDLETFRKEVQKLLK